MLDKDEIKNSLSLEQIENLVANLGGEPHRQDNTLICRTICHGGNSQERFMKIINKNEFKKLIEEYPVYNRNNYNPQNKKMQSERYEQIYKLYLTGKFTKKEIANQIGCSERTVYRAIESYV